MELREMIEAGAKKAGNQELLAKVIGVSGKFLTEAKGGRRGLPTIACGKLAEILEIDRWTVIAASELVTERNEEKRAYFAPFVERRAAAWMLATALSAIIGTTAQNDAQANDTFNASSPALKAAPLTETMVESMYIMSNR